MRTRFLAIFICLALPLCLAAQDTARIFTADQFAWWVGRYHPVARQAGLLVKQGESAVRKARGAFDPYLYTSYDQKYYDESEYYSLLSGGLKVPTWYGAELKAGIDKNSGKYLNPENMVPEGGLVYAGLTVNAAQGLVIDKRRAALRQAQIFASATYAEQQSILNDLYFDASKQYWKWVEAWNKYRVYEEAIALAMERFNAVKASYILGDMAAIDTLEAWIQVQNRQISRNEYILLYQNETLELNNFLWSEGGEPLVLTDSLRPPANDEIALETILPKDTLLSRISDMPKAHPALQLYGYKLGMLEIDRKLKAEALKPRLSISYNLLKEPVAADPLYNYNINNYKWGLQFSMPLFLRQARGDLQLSNMKLMVTRLQLQDKSRALSTKVAQYYNENLILKDQIDIYLSATENYERLLQAERQKFALGESSLFLINSRETNLINARLKLVEMKAKYNITTQGVLWSAGQLAD